MVSIAGMTVIAIRDGVLGVAQKECVAGWAGPAMAVMETWALKATTSVQVQYNTYTHKNCVYLSLRYN